MPEHYPKDRFLKALDELADGEAGEVRIVGHDLVFVAIPIAVLAKQLVADTGSVTLILDPRRPGVVRYVTRLEWEHFPPSDPMRSALLRNHWLHWLGQPWQLYTVPAAEQAVLDLVAAETEMRIADGIPTAFVPPSGKPDIFPIRHRRACCLENAPDSPMYGDPEGYRRLEAAEVDAYLVQKTGTPFPMGDSRERRN